jgi:MSHA biogenesis protein MshP
MTMTRRPASRIAGAWPSRMCGFSLVTGIFLLVVMSVLGGFMVKFTGLQQNTVQNDVLGVRAYYAARAGINWAMYRALDPDNATPAAPPTFAACPAGTLSSLSGSLAPFTVVVGCEDFDATEANRSIHVYRITATACNQTACPVAPAATPPTGYIERSVVVTVAKCKDPTTAPRYDCAP